MGYDDALVVIPWVWCPSITIEQKGERYRLAYEEWRQRGFLNVTDGNATDFKVMRDDIAQITQDYNLVDMGIDYNYQGHETSIELMEHYGLNVVKFSQGFGDMSAPTQDFEGRVKSQRIIHGGNPILRWCVGHCMIASKGDLARPVKESKNSPKKIDPIVATLMALGRWHKREQDNPMSSYNKGAKELCFI